MRQRYIDADTGSGFVWKVCEVVGKTPGSVSLADCIPVANIQGPNGLAVANSFSSRTTALRVSEHLGKSLDGLRDEDGTWGCWRWKDSTGEQMLRLCVPFTGRESDAYERLRDKSLTEGDDGTTDELLMERLPEALRALCETIITAANLIHQQLSPTSLERDYEIALASALRSMGLRALQQVRLDWDRCMDVVVEDVVIVELKKTPTWRGRVSLKYRHLVQGFHYCELANLPVCVVVNFGAPRLEYDLVLSTSFD